MYAHSTRNSWLRRSVNQIAWIVYLQKILSFHHDKSGKRLIRLKQWVKIVMLMWCYTTLELFYVLYFSWHSAKCHLFVQKTIVALMHLRNKCPWLIMQYNFRLGKFSVWRWYTHPKTSINAAQLPDYWYFVSSANFQGNKTVSNRGINAFRIHAERANQ